MFKTLRLFVKKQVNKKICTQCILKECNLQHLSEN